MSDSYNFRDIDGISRLLKILLFLGAVVALASTLSSFMQIELLNRADYTEADANDLRERSIGLVEFALRILTVVIFGTWIVRANKNVRALGANDLRITPGWAVGYFFVPILNLWRPYQAMKDLSQASRNPTLWKETPASSLLSPWWTFWILASIVGQLSFRMSFAAQTLEQVKTATYLSIVADLLDVVLCLVAMMLVGQLGQAQTNYVRTAT